MIVAMSKCPAWLRRDGLTSVCHAMFVRGVLHIECWSEVEAVDEVPSRRDKELVDQLGNGSNQVIMSLNCWKAIVSVGHYSVSFRSPE